MEPRTEVSGVMSFLTVNLPQGGIFCSRSCETGDQCDMEESWICEQISAEMNFFLEAELVL